MSGGHDPFNRGAFIWDSAVWDMALLNYFQRLIALRRARPALRRGKCGKRLLTGTCEEIGERLVCPASLAARRSRRQDREPAPPRVLDGDGGDGALADPDWALDEEPGRVARSGHEERVDQL